MDELVRRDKTADLVQPERRATQAREDHSVRPAEWVEPSPKNQPCLPLKSIPVQYWTFQKDKRAKRNR